MKEIRVGDDVVAKVEDEDVETVSGLQWRFDGRYAYADGSETRKIYMHRLIMGNPVGLQVDHINGNRLDNRRTNLRVCQHAQNIMNQKGRGAVSGFKGVHPARRGDGWCAHITLDGHMMDLGTYDTPEVAAVAYNVAARQHFGEFAWLNKVSEDIDPEAMRRSRHKRKCINGHEMTPDNVYLHKGKRLCKACRAECRRRRLQRAAGPR